MFSYARTNALDEPRARPLQAAPGHRSLSWFSLLARPVYIIVPLLILAEIIAPVPFKPSTLIGQYIGNTERQVIHTSLDIETEKAALLNKQNADASKQIEYFRAVNERLTEAYKTLMQRTIVMSQMVAELNKGYLDNRNKLAADSEQANMTMAKIGDVVGGLGDVFGQKNISEAGHNAAQSFRKDALGGVDQAMRDGNSQALQNVMNWQAGLPSLEDVDRMMADSRAHPLLPPPPPAPPQAPAPYQQ